MVWWSVAWESDDSKRACYSDVYCSYSTIWHNMGCTVIVISRVVVRVKGSSNTDPDTDANSDTSIDSDADADRLVQ